MSPRLGETKRFNALRASSPGTHSCASRNAREARRDDPRF
jgi:hypothetical protein